jgi:hypothetical protein
VAEVFVILPLFLNLTTMETTKNNTKEATHQLKHSLLIKMEDYGNTSVELYKQKAIEKVSEFSSTIISKLSLAFAFMMMIVTISIGLSLYIGEKLGKSYLGFFSVALGFVALYLILLTALNPLKREIKNKIIFKLLN